MLSRVRPEDKLFYGWMIVIAFFLVFIVLNGVNLSFGVFFKSIESQFALGRAATSAIASVNRLVGGVFAFISGWALDRYGPRIVVLVMGALTGLSLVLTSQTGSLWQLFITYSLLLGMGTGGTFVVPTAVISRWFARRRGLALGIAGTGQAVGIVIVAPVATYLISIMDWQTAYLIMGLAAWLVVMPLTGLLKRDPYEIGAFPDGASSGSTDAGKEKGFVQTDAHSLSEVFKTRSFWLMVFIWLPWALSLFLLYTHLVPHATDIGMSPEAAAGVLSLMGGSAIFGRLLMGIAADRAGSKRVVIICLLLQAVAMLWLIWARELWMFYLFALVYGFAYSGLGSSAGALVSETFKLRNIGAILGLLEASFGIGAAIGPAVGGIAFDISNSYSSAFLIGALAMFVATLLAALTRPEAGRASIGNKG
ncbi:MAG: MFS transporter [Chloroflexi bacterium]|nr:MFS transporter [Chloroflexota bacterium]